MKRPIILLLLLIFAASCSTPSQLPLSGTVTAARSTAEHPSVALATPTVFPPPSSPPTPETPTPDPAQVIDCPPVYASTLPETPPPFEDYPQLLCGYLSAGGDLDALEEHLRSWGIRGEMGEFVEKAGWVESIPDLTGDGIDEVAILAYRPFPLRQPTLLLIECTHRCRQIYRLDLWSEATYRPEIISTRDLNQNGRYDLVFTWTNLGFSSLHRSVLILECLPNPRVLPSGRLRDLGRGRINMPNGSVDVADLDGDGVFEIVMVGSRGSNCCPSRLTQDTYRWNGREYILASTEEIGEPTHRFQVFDDARRALLAGDYDSAIEHYRRTIEDESLYPWNLWEEDIPYAAPYAQYRLILTYTLADNLAAAKTEYDLLMSAFALDSSVDQPGIEFAQLAEVFWNTFTETSQVSLACQAVIDYARENPEAIIILSEKHIDGGIIVPRDLCPFTD